MTERCKAQEIVKNWEKIKIYKKSMKIQIDTIIKSENFNFKILRQTGDLVD